jgi:hypothetical protein
MENSINSNTPDSTVSTVTEKMIKIRIPDHNGHTELSQNVDLAIATIIENHFGKSKTPFIGSDVFQFTARTSKDTAAILADTITLRNRLLEDGEVTVTLTGDLVGGTDFEDMFNAAVEKRALEIVEEKLAAQLKNVDTRIPATPARIYEIADADLDEVVELVTATKEIFDMLEEDPSSPVVVRLTTKQDELDEEDYDAENSNKF